MLQVLYASAELKAKCGVRPDLDPYDEEALEQMQPLVSLANICAALNSSPFGAEHMEGLANPAPRCVISRSF